jgi:hypothetical protein
MKPVIDFDDDDDDEVEHGFVFSLGFFCFWKS